MDSENILHFVFVFCLFLVFIVVVVLLSGRGKVGHTRVRGRWIQPRRKDSFTCSYSFPGASHVQCLSNFGKQHVTVKRILTLKTV